MCFLYLAVNIGKALKLLIECIHVLHSVFMTVPDTYSACFVIFSDLR